MAVPREHHVIISAGGNHKETDTRSHKHARTPRDIQLSAAQESNAWLFNGLRTCQCVYILPSEEDSRPVVGVNQWIRKWGERGGVNGLSGPFAAGGGGFVCLDKEEEGREVLSKHVSVVSFRRRVSSPMSSFPHLEYKHIRLSVAVCPSLYNFVSQDLK